MDFSLTAEQEAFRQSVATFVAREVTPAARELDERGEFPWALFRRCADLGYLGLRYPETVGGAGADAVSFNLMCEELAYGSASLAAVVAMQCLMGTDFVYRFGTDDHKRRLLMPALRGEKIGTIAMTEPDFGSDLGGIRTRAERDGDGWILNGRKMWITSATVADFFTVAAKTDPEAGFKGIDMFLVEKDMPGVTVGRRIEKMGVRASETSEVILEGVRVPAENLLGQQGTGFRNLSAILAEIRTMTGALALGIGRAALDASLKYARERVQFGRPIGQFQAISHKLADMATQLEAARLLVYQSAWQIDVERGARSVQTSEVSETSEVFARGPIPLAVRASRSTMMLASMAKLFAAEMANKLADEATRIFGSYGFAMEYDPQRYYRDARFLLYGGGTHEILKTVIAKEIGV